MKKNLLLLTSSIIISTLGLNSCDLVEMIFDSGAKDSSSETKTEESNSKQETSNNESTTQKDSSNNDSTSTQGSSIQEGSSQSSENLPVTNLLVGVNDGGYGSQWCKNLATKFEEKYKDTSFEAGHKGVKVIIDQNTRYKGSKLVNELPSTEYEVFFTEGVNYNELVNRGLLYDISDVVTKKLSYDFVNNKEGSGEEATIESKIIADDLTEFLRIYDGNDTTSYKYYALPYFDAYYGIIYDVDLFYENNLFLAASGQGDSKGFIKSETTPLSNGIDGKAGTYDDGLPATYDEFFKLCDHMVEIGITPFTWSGKVQEYLSYFLQQLAVNYEGVKNAKTDYYFQGEITTYVNGFDGNGKPIEITKYIDKAHSYELNNKRAGKYYALEFLDKVIDNTNYYDESLCFSQSVSHLDAQQNFLYPRYIKKQHSKEVAMLIDGTWWQNEAAGKFESLVNKFGEKASAKNRRFGIMPLPKAKASKVGEPFVISNTGSSYCFIKNSIASNKVNLAKTFLQYVHTNESLCSFTSDTSATRPFNYTFDDTAYNNLTYFGKQSYNVHKQAEYLIPYSKDPDYIRNSSKVGYMWMSRINNSDYGLPSYALHTHHEYTAKDVFDGLSNFYTENYWTTNYGPFTNE